MKDAISSPRKSRLFASQIIRSEGGQEPSVSVRTKRKLIDKIPEFPKMGVTEMTVHQMLE